MFYGYTDIEGLGASVTPQEAKRFEDLNAAEAELHEEAKHYFNEGGEQALILRLFVGEPDGDEAIYGYPDHPDCVLRADCNAFIQTDIRITRV